MLKFSGVSIFSSWFSHCLSLQARSFQWWIRFFLYPSQSESETDPNVATHVRPFKKHQGDDDAAESWKKWMETRNGLNMTEVELNEINDLEIFGDLQL